MKSDCHSSRCENSNQVSNEDDPPVSYLMAFLKRLRLDQAINDNVTDPRSKGEYTLAGIIRTALSTVLFRQESKNSFHKEARKSVAAEGNIAKFCGTGEKIPHSSVADDVLCKLEIDEVNDLLLSLFENLRKNKFFSGRLDLLSEGQFFLAVDAETNHKYTPESAHDCEACPYCLKRERKATGEKWYLHVDVVASIVAPCGLRIPIYVYPVHAKNILVSSDTRDDAFKQECELSAFPKVLKRIKDRFPKTSFRCLLDSLYANGPTIALMARLGFDYIIRYKEGSIKTLSEDCDGLLKLPKYPLSHEKVEKFQYQGKKIEQRALFFNNMEYIYKENGDTKLLKLNVLRMTEKIHWLKSNKEKQIDFQWIVSGRLKKNNSLKRASQGRSRWLEEDIFNTCKNRGFNLKHDYSRQSNAQVIWRIVIMIAFFITEIFTHTKNAIRLKGSRSVRGFMKAMLYELAEKTRQALFECRCMCQKIQFRVEFEIPP